MSITVHDKNSCSSIRHEAPLTATEVVDLNKVLSQHLNDYHDVSVEFANLTDCDTLGVQLILSAKKTAIKNKKLFSIKGDVALLHQAAERIGLNLEEYLDCTA